MADQQHPTETGADCANCEAVETKAGVRDYVEIAAVFLILAAIYFMLRQIDFLPQGFAISEGVGYGLIFLIGLAASVSTCAAVTGGLLLAVTAKFNAANAHLSRAEKFRPHIYFNTGRIISYAMLGGAIGALGMSLDLSPAANGVLMLIASAAMIAIGLQMLGLLPLGWLRLRMPAALSQKVNALVSSRSNGGMFLLGALTFFLPCGFTQALQLYVLAQGSVITGAVVMFVFALGTLPALISISAISSFTSGALQRHALKVAGVAVLFLGLINLQPGLMLADSSANLASLSTSVDRANDRRAQIVDGIQTVEMKVIGLSYEPNQFVVTRGVPVVWRIEAREAEGCGRVLIAPRASVRKLLSATATNVITFIPEDAGEISFNCGMGMMTPNSKFVVVAETVR